ncbi:hypothetical protein LTR28_004293 [Elasticomyces elasticus]|nr:hypothetical protein LTR28_004293 [Elasticomyces elasticus]
MAIWPFGRKQRRSSAMRDQTPATVEKARPAHSPSRQTPQPVPIPVSVGGISRRSSKRGSQRKKRTSTKARETQWTGSKAEFGIPEKEKLPRGSVEDITALPVAKELGVSPHLRPVTLDRAGIPYNFHDRPHSLAASRPQTPRSKYSSNDATAQRRRSLKKRKDELVREEEIRAMSAPVSIPKRPAGASEGLLKRDSKKVRAGLRRESNISLPLEDSIHSSMSGIIEHHGFVVNGFDVFTARPTIRLSGYPQSAYTSSTTGVTGMSHDVPKIVKRSASGKRVAKKQQHRRVDDLVDVLDASELRRAMERDQRRRDKKKVEQQQQLDRQLRRRADKQRAEEEKIELETTQATSSPLPAAIHPALRDTTPNTMGLGINNVGPSPDVRRTTELESIDNLNTNTSPNSSHGDRVSENPFADPKTSTNALPIHESTRLETPFADPSPELKSNRELKPAPETILSLSNTPVETLLSIEAPTAEPVIGTAQAIRVMTPSMSPPSSPIANARATSSMPRLNEYHDEVISDLPMPPEMPQALAERRPSDASSRRAGAWASFFRRGGTKTAKQPDEQGVPSPSEYSFSNTSRDSMSRQPPPAHLVGPVHRVRTKPGTPVRTQSKFREDLPEMPLSPPDSRVQSPEVALPAAGVAVLRKLKHTPEPIDIVGPSSSMKGSYADLLARRRTDSPVSPDGKGVAVVMSSSLASVDSEGSWLTGRPSKRISHQSQGLTRGGSLSKQKQDFNASYEELGIPDDEYFRRLTPTAGIRAKVGDAAKQTARKSSSAAVVGAADIESDYSEDDAPIPKLQQSVSHGSVHRQPTIVHRERRVLSREGLVAQYEEGPSPADSTDKDYSPSEYEDEPPDMGGPAYQRARSVDYGKAHARQLSAGSAKLLDIPARSASRMRGDDDKRQSSASLGAPRPRSGFTSDINTA